MSMGESPNRSRPRWFVGDLEDPWVAAIARSVDRLDVKAWHHPGAFPESWSEILEEGPPESIVLHRPGFAEADCKFLRNLRAEVGPDPFLVLCFGMQTRHADLERCSRWADLIISESSAAETLGRHLGKTRSNATKSRRIKGRDVAIISPSHEACLTISEMLRSGLHRPSAIVQTHPVERGSLVVWQVPILDPHWPTELARLSAEASIITLLGFADRRIVQLAFDMGASSCLEWPCDPEDLLDSLDRIGNLRFHGGHPAIPKPQPLIRHAQESIAGADLASGI